LDQWDEAFDDFAAEIEEYIEAGESVVTLTHWRAMGKGSALVTDLHTADVVEFADGKIVRMTIGYVDRAEALKAAGRSTT
jgi:ketosteroid isomerase-like protein